MNGVEDVPQRGDIVWMDFNPQIGREQAGRRPALVISPRDYNARVGLVIVCPITSVIKGYAFELELPAGAGASGAVLCDQPRSIDWRGRQMRFISRVDAEFLTEVGEKLRTLLPLF